MIKVAVGIRQNIGSINKISDILSGRGMFSRLGEKWFDDYWMNYGKITITDDNGSTKKDYEFGRFRHISMRRHSTHRP